MSNSWVAMLMVPLFIGGVPAQDPDQLLVFPNLVSGVIGDLLFQDIFVVQNNGDESVQVGLRMYTNEGVERTHAPRDMLQVPPGETRSVELTTDFIVPPLHPPNINGWALLTLPAHADVTAQSQLFLVDREKTGPWSGDFSSANSLAVVPGMEFRFVLPNMAFKNAHSLAIVNPSEDQDVEVQVRITTESGPVCEATLNVARFHRLTRFVEGDLCEELSGDGREPVQGTVTISTVGVPIAVSAMQLLTTTGGFAPLPVERLKP